MSVVGYRARSQAGTLLFPPSASQTRQRARSHSSTHPPRSEAEPSEDAAPDEVPENVQKLVDELCSLNVIEMNQLVKSFKDKVGLTVSSPWHTATAIVTFACILAAIATSVTSATC